MAEKIIPEAQREALTFKGRLLPELPEHYVEPSSVNPLIVPHGAMPANPYFNESIKEQQRFVNGQFLKLYQSPPQDMPEEFVEDVVIDDYIIHEERRKMENYEAFMEFFEDGVVIDESVLPILERFERGQASIDEILMILANPNIDAREDKESEFKSGEFGKVSHPYGYRMEQLEPFRNEMNEAILAQGGVVYPTVMPYRSIKILPRLKRFNNGTPEGGVRIIGFIVKYKRDYGHVPVVGKDDEVVRVVERQIAAYRVDEASGFNQNIIQAMHDMQAQYPKRMLWDSPVMNQREQQVLDNRLKSVGCTDFVEYAVQTDSLRDFVVPISTTIYGYKEKLPEKLSVDPMARVALESALNSTLDLMPPSY